MPQLQQLTIELGTKEQQRMESILVHQSEVTDEPHVQWLLQKYATHLQQDQMLVLDQFGIDFLEKQLSERDTDQLTTVHSVLDI